MKITPEMVRRLRERLLARPLTTRVRIKRNGEVHVHGRMPNTNKVGWYFAGFENELIAQYEYFQHEDE